MARNAKKKNETGICHLMSHGVILLVFIVITLVSCHFDNSHSGNYIQPELDSVLTEFIEKHPEDSIYSLIFYQNNNKQFFNIQCSDTHYDSRFVDACFVKNGKIITVCSINNSLMDSLINIPPSNQCFDLLEKYNNSNEEDCEPMCYDMNGNMTSYRILKLNVYRKTKDSDFLCTDSVRSCNVIKSQAINRVLNDYLNSGWTDITYLRFNTQNGTNYMTIGDDYVYDKEEFSGMFYRDGRIVVIYDLNKLANLELIDKKRLLPATELKYYKAIHRKKAKFYERKYEILSKENIVRVSGTGFDSSPQ